MFDKIIYYALNGKGHNIININFQHHFKNVKSGIRFKWENIVTGDVSLVNLIIALKITQQLP